MKSIVVYQAYGPTFILEQNLFSVLSLFRQHKDFTQVEKVLIYTDNQSYFASYLGNCPQVQYEPITPERLAAWRGDIQFVHRVKIEMILDAAFKFPNHNLFYLDGDTYFTKDPSSLLPQIDVHHSIMHEAENVVSLGKDPLSKKVAKFLKKFEFGHDGKKIKIPVSMTMWNAGVLGISPAFFPSLKFVLNLTDQSYSKYKKHVMEQMAFSYFLAMQTQILSGADYVHHYWRQKEEYGVLIHQFLGLHTNLNAGLKNFESISWPPQLVPKKTFYLKLTEKLLKKVFF